MKDKLLEMLKENGTYSLTRVLPTIGYSVFILVSIGLAIFGKEWGNYPEFAMATGGAIIVQLGNKWINSRWNSEPGKAGKPYDAKEHIM